jgi:hypothetical protein
MTTPAIQALEKLRMCVAEAGYDPFYVVLNGSEPTVIVRDSEIGICVPQDVAERALDLVYGEDRRRNVWVDLDEYPPPHYEA